MISSLTHQPRSATFPPALTSARRARQFLLAELLDAGIDQPLLADRLSLVASELVTNAVVHAGTDIEVRLTIDADDIRLEVSDQGSAPLVRADHDGGAGVAHTDTNGRGLVLVGALVEAWGVTDVDGGFGKTVWADIGRT